MIQIYALSDGCTPTEDLYFKSPISKELTARKKAKVIWINCKKNLPNKFFERHSNPCIFIVFRTLPADWLAALCHHKHSRQKVIYILDDDLKAAKSTPELPEKYRSRISMFADQHMDSLLHLSDKLIVCSEHLAREYADFDPVILNPTLLFNSVKKTNFITTSPTIFYHATRSHKDDLYFLRDLLLETLNSNKCKFESLIGSSTPKNLSSHKKVTVRTPKSWESFKLFQRLAKRQIGLAPLLDTPYNRGKSYIKFLDIAAVGAVGIFSNRPPYTNIVDHGINGFLADDDQEQWREYLNYLIKNPHIANKMARKAGEKAAYVGHPKHSYKFWLKQLSLVN